MHFHNFLLLIYKHKNVYIGNGSITGASDGRDKTNICDMDIGIEFIKTIRPVTFEWNRRDGLLVGDKSAGFIAQELLEAQQKCEIGENLDIVNTTNLNKLGVRYNNLIVVMVKAIQELNEKINKLQEEVIFLKTNL